jgi:hypothetical protein
MPFGIVAIVKAASVSSRREAGDWEGAWRESAEAKKWTTWSLLSGLAVIALYIAAYIVILVLGIKHSSLF